MGSLTSFFAAAVSFIAAGAGAIARNLQTKVRETVTPEDFNVVGNNIADDTIPFQNAVNAALATGVPLQVEGTYYVPGGLTLGALRMIGRGLLRGTAVGLGGTPTTTILTQGTQAASLSLGAGNIAKGTTAFAVVNTYAVGDVVRISNNTGVPATSRQEILQIATITGGGTGFTTDTPCVEHYAAGTGAIVQKMNFIDGLSIEGIKFSDILFTPKICKGMTLRNIRALRCAFVAYLCYQWSMHFEDFDGGGLCTGTTQGLDASRNFSISGNFHGGVGISDNGFIKTMQAQKYSIDAVVTGTINNGGQEHAFQADTYYAANPSGFDYGSNLEAKVNIVFSNCYGSAVQLTAPDVATADVSLRDFYISGVVGEPGNTLGGLNAKNASNITICAEWGGATGAGFQLGAVGTNVQDDINFVGWNGNPGVMNFNGTNTNIRGLDIRALALLSANTGAVTGNATAYTVLFNSIAINSPTGAYAAGTGLFTVPVTGEYEIETMLDLQAIAAAHTLGSVRCWVNGAAAAVNVFNPGAIMSVVNEVGIPSFWRMRLNKGDTVGINVVVNNGALAIIIGGAALYNTWFSIRHINS